MPIFQPSMMKSSSSSRARGGGDAGSLTPRCSVTPIRCMRRDVISTKTCHQHLVRTTTTTTTKTTTTTTRRFTQVNRCVNLLWNPSCRAMSDSAGAAARRRGRRLRAWHRHVKMVAMELATALHHSVQRVEVPREGEVREQHFGLHTTSPGDAASTAVGGAAAGGGAAARRGPDRRRSWVTDARWSCAAYGGTAGGRVPAP